MIFSGPIDLTLTLIVVALVMLGLVIFAVILLYFQIRRLQDDRMRSGDALRDITQAVQQELIQIVTLGEKIGSLEPAIQIVGNLQAEVRGLTERIVTVEKGQESVYKGVVYLARDSLAAITELKTLTGGLTESTSAMRAELSRAKNDLTELHTHVSAEREIDRQIAESIRRLETVLAGTQTKGSAGESILEVVFARLPVEWQLRDFKIGGKTVEFALRLPNNLILPIDSKWAATNLLDQFLNSEDLLDQQRLKKAIEEVVLQKAREVRKYIDPSVTVNFCVAVVPDAIYDLCAGILPELFMLNVVLVSYSMFIPYLLLVFQTVLKTSHSIDLQKLDAYITSAQQNISELQEELDGRFSRAITMLNNSRDEMRAMVSKIGGCLTGLQIGSGNSVPLLSEDTMTESDKS